MVRCGSWCWWLFVVMRVMCCVRYPSGRVIEVKKNKDKRYIFSHRVRTASFIRSIRTTKGIISKWPHILWFLGSVHRIDNNFLFSLFPLEICSLSVVHKGGNFCLESRSESGVDWKKNFHPFFHPLDGSWKKNPTPSFTISKVLEVSSHHFFHPLECSRKIPPLLDALEGSWFKKHVIITVFWTKQQGQRVSMMKDKCNRGGAKTGQLKLKEKCVTRFLLAMDGGDHPDFSTPKIVKFSSGKKERWKKREKISATDTALSLIHSN